MELFNIDVFTGMTSIAVVYIGFSIVYLFNMIGGVMINCQIEKTEKFSFEKFLLSLEKVLFCAAAMFGLVVSTNLVAQGLFNIDPNLASTVTSIISIATFALVFAKGFIQKALDLVAKIKYLLEIQDTSKQPDMEKINSMTLEELIADPELNNDGTTPLG